MHISNLPETLGAEWKYDGDLQIERVDLVLEDNINNAHTEIYEYVLITLLPICISNAFDNSYERNIKYNAYPYSFCGIDDIVENYSKCCLVFYIKFLILILCPSGVSIMSRGVGTVHQLFVPSSSSPLVNFDTSLAKYSLSIFVVK